MTTSKISSSSGVCPAPGKIGEVSLSFSSCVSCPDESSESGSVENSLLFSKNSNPSLTPFTPPPEHPFHSILMSSETEKEAPVVPEVVSREDCETPPPSKTPPPDCLESGTFKSINPFMQEWLQAPIELKEKTTYVQTLLKKFIKTIPRLDFYINAAGALTFAGVRAVLGMMVSKHPEAKDIQVMYSDEFYEEAKKLKILPAFSKSYIVFCKQKGGGFSPLYCCYSHFTHIYAYKNQGETFFLHTDSGGSNDYRKNPQVFPKNFTSFEIYDGMNFDRFLYDLLENEFNDAELHVLHYPRQKDRFTCSVYALHDALQCVRLKEKAFQCIEEPSPTYRRVKIITHPIMEMMTLNQFPTKTTEWFDTSYFTGVQIEKMPILKRKLKKYATPLSLAEKTVLVNRKPFHIFTKMVIKLVDYSLTLPSVSELSSLRNSLSSMYNEDQEGRTRMIEMGVRNSSEDLMKIIQSDTRHRVIFKDITTRYGWLGIDCLGEEGSESMWALAQHADMDVPFQKTCLELLTKAYEKKAVKGSHVALLTDRILKNEHKLQIYGTQFDWIPSENKLRFIPIVDPENLNIRRAEMGLKLFEKYVEEMKLQYHSSSHTIGSYG